MAYLPSGSSRLTAVLHIVSPRLVLKATAQERHKAFKLGLKAASLHSVAAVCGSECTDPFTQAKRCCTEQVDMEESYQLPGPA